MLEVRLLGQFDVRVAGKSLKIPSRPAQSLLAYLLLNTGAPKRREKLAGLLWPDASESNARSNLRHALWRIRKALETVQPSERNYITANDLTIGFEATPEVWLDVDVLERKSNGDESTEDLMEAVALYRGELLPGFYDDWIVLERERVQAVFEHKMQHLLDRLVEAQRWPEALEWGERWIASGQIPEPAYRALMAAHHGLGDRVGVGAIYRRCVGALHRDLGAEPSDETQDLYRSLLTPTAYPLEALIASLTHDSASVTARATLMDDLARDRCSLLAYVRRLLSQGAYGQGNGNEARNCVPIVDQFEELFTLYSDEAQRRALVDSLLTAAGLCLTATQDSTESNQDGSSLPSSLPDILASTAVVIAALANFYAHYAG